MLRVLLRFALEFVLIVVAARAFWRLVGGFVEGATGRATGRPAARAPDHGVPMVRDPNCGTFVLPDRAVILTNGRQRIFFCSTTCRDAYRAQRGAGRWGPHET